jgi:hypothetical protein
MRINNSSVSTAERDLGSVFRAQFPHDVTNMDVHRRLAHIELALSACWTGPAYPFQNTALARLASCGTVKRDVMPGIEHRQHKGLNNRAENSHQATRRR